MRGQVLTSLEVWACACGCDYTGPCGLGIGLSPRCNKIKTDAHPDETHAQSHRCNKVRTTLAMQRLFYVALMHTSST